MSTHTPFVPELLSPAGSLKNMRYAFAYGADAVYAGQPRYSLRVRNNEFNHENLQIGIDEAHALGKKLYVVCNIQPHNSKLKTFIRDLKPVVEMGPDALIMSDPGLIMMVREAFPEMPIHLSVQANAVNWATVKFWASQGVERVILSRELSLEEIEEIREQCPTTELEIFVHGALCMAYSGRCLLSGYINKRDPNQGTCTNACRWEYKVESAKEDETGQIVEKFDPVAVQTIEIQEERPDNTLGLGKPIDDVVLLSESHRPEEKMAAFEDEHGTYIMNSKDLRAVQHVERLTKMGVHSLKIEGRTKSFYYCARTAQVYRKAIDDAVSGKPFDESLMGTLESLAHRGYTEGFLRRHTHDTYQNYDYGYSVSDSQQFVGEFTGKRRGEMAEVEVKNKFILGDSLEL
ncbi:prephenate-dependent tRNA uridine(34) hydroxylase TrhP, partial [Vibrio sp. V10_P2A27P122]